MAPIEALCHMPLSLPHGVAIVLIDPCGKARKSAPRRGDERRETDSMKWRRFIPHILLFFGGLGYALWSFVRRPFPMLGDSPLLDLMDYHTPNFYGWVMLWYYASPFVTVMLAGLILLSVWKVWLEARRRDFAPFGALPTWPLSTQQKAPAIVIGGGPSPGRGAGDFQSFLAHHPGARAVYRRGDFRSRRVREDFGLHAPLRQAASRLPSRESTDAGGGAHA